MKAVDFSGMGQDGAVYAPRYNYTINGLRGLCVILIFLFHIEQSKIVPSAISNSIFGSASLYFISSFKYGVELFFMISGYVIVKSLHKHATIGSFLLDRALRLFPAWLPVHVFLFFTATLMGHELFKDIDSWHWILYFFTNLIFLSPIIYFFPILHIGAWSLNYEWVFYLLAAATVINARLCGKWCGVTIIVIIAALIINFFPRGFFFIPGIVVALNEIKIQRNLRFYAFPSICLILFFMAWHATGADRVQPDVTVAEWMRDSRIWFASAAAFIGTYFFASIVFGRGLLSQWLHSRFFQFVGKISYSFYLWSVIVMHPCKHIASSYLAPHFGAWTGFVTFTLFSFVFSIVLAWASWNYIEISLTKKIRHKLHKKEADSFFMPLPAEKAYADGINT